MAVVTDIHSAVHDPSRSLKAIRSIVGNLAGIGRTRNKGSALLFGVRFLGPGDLEFPHTEPGRPRSALLRLFEEASDPAFCQTLPPLQVIVQLLNNALSHGQPKAFQGSTRWECDGLLGKKGQLQEV